MKITKAQLKKIIKEELGRALREVHPDVEEYEWMKSDEDYQNTYKFAIAIEHDQPISTELGVAVKKELSDYYYGDTGDGIDIGAGKMYPPSSRYTQPTGAGEEYWEMMRRADQLYALNSMLY